MSRIPIRSIEDAPEEALDRLRSARKAIGYLPHLHGVLANAPAALEAYQVVGAIHARGGLSAAEGEAIQIVAAARNACEPCVAGHAALARRKVHMAEDTLQALRRARAPADPRLGALARFTLAIMDKRGRVEDDELREFLAAGYTEANALEVILGVSLATLCNYANNLAQAPVDPELRAPVDSELEALA